jgi:hypothetical protein
MAVVAPTDDCIFEPFAALESDSNPAAARLRSDRAAGGTVDAGLRRDGEEEPG